MICFSDTDILLKLIQFRLINEALAALGVTHQEVYVTPEAASKCRHSRRYQTSFTRQTLTQAENFLKRVTVIAASGDLEEAICLLMLILT